MIIEALAKQENKNLIKKKNVEEKEEQSVDKKNTKCNG